MEISAISGLGKAQRSLQRRNWQAGTNCVENSAPMRPQQDAGH